MSCNNKDFTITFDERVKGWTSFHSFYPDFITGMNSQLFTFSGGNLYIHHSDAVDRGVYYGTPHSSKISVIINDNPSEVKEIKAVSLEGNHSWDTLIKAYISMVDDFTETSINDVEFVRKEGIWYAYARRNENEGQTDSKSLYGIGVITEIDGNVITVNGYNDTLMVGDQIVKGQDFSIIGTITNAVRTGNTTELTVSTIGSLIVDDFVCGMKDPRIEGGNLRGYSMRFDLDIYKPTKVELFAVNAEVFKSYR